MKDVFLRILPYIWLPFYILGIYGCAISLVKTEKFAKKKKFTPDQKKKYFLAWGGTLLLLLFLTALEIRDILEMTTGQ